MYGQMFGTFNEDDYVIYTGRLATSCGLFGMVLGLILSSIFSFTTLGTVLAMIGLAYLFTTGFWGAYNLDRWFRRYKFRIPTTLWQLLRVPVVILGLVLGIIGWGVFEHFILLLAMGLPSPGLIAAQIILLPWIGSWFSNYIDYNPYGTTGGHQLRG